MLTDAVNVMLIPYVGNVQVIRHTVVISTETANIDHTKATTPAPVVSV